MTFDQWLPTAFPGCPSEAVRDAALRAWNAATAQARDTNTALNRRTQAAEAALADLLRCNEKLASGSAWCGGSLGRAFLAYANSQLKEENDRLKAGRPEPDESLMRLRDWLADPDRKTPPFAFTAGSLRECADWVNIIIGRAVAAERTRCAAVADSFASHQWADPKQVAKAIREAKP